MTDKARSYIIQSDDVGRAHIERDVLIPAHRERRKVYVHGVMGRIQPGDVGKVLYVAADGHVSVESDEQLEHRRERMEDDK